MASPPLNVVFFPHPVNHGLAGTNRLQNIIYFLKKQGVGSVSNISLSDSPAEADQLTGEPFLKEYKEIYYGPSAWNFVQAYFPDLYLLKQV